MTCPGTFVPSHVFFSNSGVREIAAQAEVHKAEKYFNLDSRHMFTPEAKKTSWVMGPRSVDFIKQLFFEVNK